MLNSTPDKVCLVLGSCRYLRVTAQSVTFSRLRTVYSYIYKGATSSLPQRHRIDRLYVKPAAGYAINTEHTIKLCLVVYTKLSSRSAAFISNYKGTTVDLVIGGISHLKLQYSMGRESSTIQCHIHVSSVRRRLPDTCRVDPPCAAALVLRTYITCRYNYGYSTYMPYLCITCFHIYNYVCAGVALIHTRQHTI